MEKNKSAYNNNKFKISASTQNDIFDLPDGSYSIADIQDYFEFITKKHENLTENPPLQIYTNKIKIRIVFKIETGYKLELLSPETMKLLRSTKKKMFIKIKMEKMCQNQNHCNLVKLSTNIESIIYFCTKETIWTANKYFTTFINNARHDKYRIFTY